MNRAPNKGVAVRAGLLYLALSIVWILVSDELVAGLPLSAHELQILQSSKGTLFVLVSAGVLYAGLALWERRAQHEWQARMQVSEALTESEARFSQLASSIEEVFYLTSLDKGQMLYVSPAYERIWGRECLELTRNPYTWLEAIHEEDRERVRQALPLQAQGLYDQTYRILTPSGQLRWIRDRAFPVCDESGRAYRVAGVAREVTSQQEMLLRLKESEERYHRTVDLTPDAIFVNCEGAIVMVNPAMVRLLGARDESELLGRNPLEFIVPEYRDRVSQHIQLNLQNPEVRLPPEERKFLGLDGRVVPVERHVVPFRNQGKPAILVVLHDLTERDRAQQTLEQQKRRLEAVIQSSLDGIVMLDAEERVVLFNPAAEKMFERSLATAMGCHRAELVREPSKLETVAALRGVGLRAGQEEFPLELTQVLIEMEGGFLWVLTCRDLTQTDLLETQRAALEMQLRQSQKMEAVGQLAGGVAHDFNNLLTVMLGNVSLVKGEENPDPEALEEILHAIHRASDLTRQLLTFSRRQVMQVRHLDLNQIIGNVIKMLTRILGEDIQIHTDLQDALPLVEADPGMMEQVLVNLAVNARDAMPQGGELWLETSALEVSEELAREIPLGVPGRYVCLSVSDNGTGIAEGDLGHIFEPFFTTKEVGKGTGLGLATVYGIVAQHRGGIRVESQMGEGTTFRVYLPGLAGPAAPSVPVAKALSCGGKETILLVEDDPAVLLLLKNVLRQAGYTILSAASGVEALKVWQGHGDPIEVLVTDLVMPEGVSGVELAQTLLARKPELKVLYMTGYEPARAAGKVVLDPRLVLEKPFGPETLLNRLREILA